MVQGADIFNVMVLIGGLVAKINFGIDFIKRNSYNKFVKEGKKHIILIKYNLY